MQIAIDGPASAGKSTIAKLVAKKLGYIYCDTGAMYRTVTYMALKDQLPLDDETTILQHLSQLQIRFAPGDPEQRVFMNDEDVTLAIREPDVTNNVSQVAALPGVRTELVERQRDIAAKHDIVMDGRDIGTTVLPHAALKIFMVASVSERANRPYLNESAAARKPFKRELKRHLPRWKRKLLSVTAKIPSGRFHRYVKLTMPFVSTQRV